VGQVGEGGGPRGVSWLTGGGLGVAVHGGSVTASTAVGGVAPFHRRRRRLEKGGASGCRGRWRQ
jgi:hypothetical protein